MRALSKQVRDALQSLPDAAVLVDAEGRIALANSLAGLLAEAATSEALRGTMLKAMPGVFVAGDIHSGATMQIASAVGEGATAALKIREYLEGHKHPIQN